MPEEQLIDPVQCEKCGDWVSQSELNEKGHCSICAALYKLRDCLERRGILHPEFPGLDKSKNTSLPPSDRE